MGTGVARMLSLRNARKMGSGLWGAHAGFADMIAGSGM